MSIGEICNRDVVFTLKSSTVQQGAGLMRQHHVGCLVVVEDGSDPPTPVGMVTDRDLVVEIMAENVPVDRLSIGDVMSNEVASAREDEGVWDVIQRMRVKGVRRMPVVDVDGGLVGIVTMDDMVELLAEELSDLAKLMGRELHREQETRTKA